MTGSPGVNSKLFPKVRIQEILGRWWDSKVLSPLRKPKAPSQARSQGGTVFDIQPELSSQQAVGVLLQLRDCLEYEPKPNKVIRRGGYNGRSQFLEQLCNALENDFNIQNRVSEHSGKQIEQLEIKDHAEARL